MKMVDLHLKVEEACNKPGRGGRSDAFKASLVATLASGPPPTIINGKAPDQAAAKNWRDRKLKAYKTAKEVMTSSGGARVAGKEIPEALYRKLEALFRPIEKAIVPTAGSVAQSGGGMTEEERAAFIAARNAASSSFSSSSSLSSSSSASSSSCASSAPKKMTIKEASRMPLSLDGAHFALGSDDEEGHLAALNHPKLCSLVEPSRELTVTSTQRLCVEWADGCRDRRRGALRHLVAVRAPAP